MRKSIKVMLRILLALAIILPVSYAMFILYIVLSIHKGDVERAARIAAMPPASFGAIIEEDGYGALRFWWDKYAPELLPIVLQQEEIDICDGISISEYRSMIIELKNCDIGDKKIDEGRFPKNNRSYLVMEMPSFPKKGGILLRYSDFRNFDVKQWDNANIPEYILEEVTGKTGIDVQIIIEYPYQLLEEFYKKEP